MKSKTADYVFLSHPRCNRTYCIDRLGRIRLWKESETPEEPIVRKQLALETLFLLDDFLPEWEKWNWEKGYLPILCVSDQTGKQLRMLAQEEGSLLLETPVGDTFCFPGNTSCPATLFREEYDRIEAYWTEWFANGITLDDPSPDWRSSLVQAKTAFWGRHPKYGVEKYAQYRADAFPPTICSMCETLFRFGHHREARETAEYYFNRFIRRDGTIDYYGPAISEYGDLLRLGAMLGRPEDGGETFFRNCAETFLLMAAWLYGQMNVWMPSGIKSATGLIVGIPEADTRDDPAAYLHCNLAVLRGFMEMKKLFGIYAFREAAMEMDHMAEDLSWNLRKWIAASRKFPFLPWKAELAELPETFCDSLDAAYANYRYLPEMLQSGLLPRKDALRLIEAREQRGGEENGMTVFRWRGALYDRYDNWPIAAYAKGLLEYGETERFEKVLNGHRNFYQTQDTFTTYESILRNTDTVTAASDWCVPVQLALPLMLILKKEMQCLPEQERLRV